jgi:pantoate--beta-alanine ligase
MTSGRGAFPQRLSPPVQKPAELRVVESIADLRSRVAARRGTRTVGLVPTMGALHAGHARLIETARHECGTVVVSVFVNPIQFDRQTDIEKYPRSLEADRELCQRLGVDLVFAPAAGEMYPGDSYCMVEVGRIGDELCGRYRPGHFRGVATIVLKLLNIVQPERAYFGEKDAQQLAVIRRIVRDFNLPVAIVGVPTVREPDGLALSSRNQHLTTGERPLAVALHDALCEARKQIEAGNRDVARVKLAAVAKIPDAPALKLEFLEIVDPDDMEPVHHIDRTVCIAGALWVGSTRLIDNIVCDPSLVPAEPPAGRS